MQVVIRTGVTPVKSCLSGILLLLMLACVQEGFAEISGSLSLTSNYFWRGYTKSDDHWAAQGFVDYQQPNGFFAGSWLSRVDFDDDVSSDAAGWELSPYIGWSFALSSDWRTNVELVRYFYDGEIFGASANYNELDIRAHFRDLFSAQFACTNDAYNQGNATYDGSLGGRYPVTDTLQVSAGGGYSVSRKVFEYNTYYWDTGLTWYWPWGGIDVRYTGARETDGGYQTDWGYHPDIVRGEIIVTLSVGF
jgi:uncharacterized protein (TIGR02001 family)